MRFLSVAASSAADLARQLRLWNMYTYRETHMRDCCSESVQY